MGLLTRQLQSSGLCRLDNCNNSERSSRRFIKTNEAPYQTVGKRTFAATLGYKELFTTSYWLSLLSECLSCYLYVFIVCSTRISWTGTIIGHEPNLLAMALSSGIAMMLLVRTFQAVHVNPALTISFLLTGRIPIIRAITYTLVHCLGSVAAIAFLYSISVKGHAGALGLDNPHYSLELWQVLIVEVVISFVVTIVTYATCNYSSYTSARGHILEQVGQNTNLFSNTSSNCDPFLESATASRPNLSVPPRRQTATNYRVRPQISGFIPDKYPEESSDYEYEYDNHRIYAQQQSNMDSPPVEKMPPIEEVLQDESQLLAPNGFPLHITTGQAFVIGLSYTLASLSGIPASGASLNPARSFGPAFIMNRWENHWVYWIGPILGAVIAGFLYEFVFNPTRSSSVCYLPKLFRLSAHDMAKVGTKSRLYQQQQQKRFSPLAPVPNFTSTTGHRPRVHHLNTMHASPTSSRTLMAPTSIPISNSTILDPSRDPQQLMSATSSSMAHLQSPNFMSNNFDPMNYLKQQQHHHHQLQQQHHQPTFEAVNFERGKSSAIINLLATKQQQSTINLPQANGVLLHSNSASDASAGGASSNNSDFGKFQTNNFRKNFQDHSMMLSTSSKPTFSEL